MTYLASIITFLVIVVGLSMMIIAVSRKLIGTGEFNLLVNDEEEPIKTAVGTTLLDALTARKIFIPSACGGQATCFMCKLKVPEGGGQVLPTEKMGMTRKEVKQGIRLSCQVKVRGDMKVEVPPEIFSIKEYDTVVTSNDNVATFIKELNLDIVDDSIEFRAGDYVQINVPRFPQIQFNGFDVDDEYKPDWDKHDLWKLKCKNPEEIVRAYSVANYPAETDMVKLNVRIATPPPRKRVPPGIGSTYIFNLTPGDKVKITGPYGEFHIKDTDNEMLYLGGGAGMAPMRSHIYHLFKTLKTNRKVTFWYGARSVREMFYDDEFKAIEKEFPNFKYVCALSEKEPEDDWDGPEGFIHQVCNDMYLNDHPDPTKIEYYLCGPELMIDAVLDMLLVEFEVPDKMIAYDKF